MPTRACAWSVVRGCSPDPAGRARAGLVFFRKLFVCVQDFLTPRRFNSCRVSHRHAWWQGEGTQTEFEPRSARGRCTAKES